LILLIEGLPSSKKIDQLWARNRLKDQSSPVITPNDRFVAGQLELARDYDCLASAVLEKAHMTN